MVPNSRAMNSTPAEIFRNFFIRRYVCLLFLLSVCGLLFTDGIHGLDLQGARCGNHPGEQAARDEDE